MTHFINEGSILKVCQSPILLTTQITQMKAITIVYYQFKSIVTRPDNASMS